MFLNTTLKRSERERERKWEGRERKRNGFKSSCSTRPSTTQRYYFLIWSESSCCGLFFFWFLNEFERKKNRYTFGSYFISFMMLIWFLNQEKDSRLIVEIFISFVFFFFLNRVLVMRKLVIFVSYIFRGFGF